MLQADIERYLESLQIANLSQNTLKTYRHALNELACFVGPEADSRDIDVNVIRAHVHLLATKGLSTASRNQTLRMFKAFGRFLLDEGIVDENIFEAMPQAKSTIRLIESPSIETVTKLLDGEIPTHWPKRDRALLELLYGTGARVQEAAGVRLGDLRSDRTLLLHGKGSKDRLVPVGRMLQKALDAYLPERSEVLRRRNQESDALFFQCGSPLSVAPNSIKNVRPNPEALTVRSVARVLTAVCQAKGLKPLNPHSLRHACATHMLDNGAPLVVIKELLGHNKLSTTAQYAFVSLASMQRSYAAAHPHAYALVS